MEFLDRCDVGISIYIRLVGNWKCLCKRNPMRITKHIDTTTYSGNPWTENDWWLEEYVGEVIYVYVNFPCWVCICFWPLLQAVELDGTWVSSTATTLIFDVELPGITFDLDFGWLLKQRQPVKNNRFWKYFENFFHSLFTSKLSVLVIVVVQSY